MLADAPVDVHCNETNQCVLTSQSRTRKTQCLHGKSVDGYTVYVSDAVVVALIQTLGTPLHQNFKYAGIRTDLPVVLAVLAVASIA